MSAEDLTTGSHLQPKCGVEWLKLSLIASKTLQNIKRVYLQSFTGIGTCNQKLFSKIAQCPPKFLPQLYIYSQNVGLNG
jgi:hypothetical protein